jgi:hypothetical protein
MTFKILTVVAESTEREAVPLGDKIQKAVEEFLSSKEGGVLEKLDIVPEYTHGNYGRALVTVYFAPKATAKATSKS